MRRWGASAALLAVALAIAACSDDDAADPTTAPTSVEPTAAPETADTSTTSTIRGHDDVELDDDDDDGRGARHDDGDQLKAEIEAAYRDLDAKGYAMLQNPTLDGLEAKVAEIAIPGSPYAEAVTIGCTQLVQNGQYLVPDDPSHRQVTVESSRSMIHRRQARQRDGVPGQQRAHW